MTFVYETVGPAITNVNIEYDGKYEHRVRLTVKSNAMEYEAVPLDQLPADLAKALRALFAMDNSEPINYMVVSVNYSMALYAPDTQFDIELVRMAPGSPSWPGWFGQPKKEISDGILEKMGEQ